MKAVLAAQGIKTLRIPAVEVLDSVDTVLTYIVGETIARIPLHRQPSAGGPPPQGDLGEDL
ncbi:MAG: hypothetical protein AB7G25_18660 [Sphingomonadaceae bacterium]